jgi:Beta-lactamase superfamily domain
MQVEWYGQSAFRVSDGATTVFIDPFDDVGAMAERGLRWDYPAIEGVQADLLLVTHEHRDHNGIGAIAGDPPTLRSTAGRLQSPIGEVLAVASEHDEAAGTERGPKTLFAFTLGAVGAWPTSGTSARPTCARSRRGRWAASTSSSSRSAAVRRSAPSRPRPSRPA